MRNVRDIVKDLLKDNTVREKVPYTPPPAPKPSAAAAEPVAAAPIRTPKVRKEVFVPIHERKTDTSGVRFLDHTVEIDGEIGGGFLVRDRGVDIGFIWCIQSAWRYCTMNKQETGAANTKRAATEALQELRSKRG